MTEELICDNYNKISYRLRSKLWMKYVKIYNNYETKKDINVYDRLINNLKEELSQLQDYTTSQLYKKKDADFRNGILDSTKCILKLLDCRLKEESKESLLLEEKLLKHFDDMRKLSNLYVQSSEKIDK